MSTSQSKNPINGARPSPPVMELLGDATHQLMLGGIDLLGRTTRNGSTTAGHLLGAYWSLLRRAKDTAEQAVNTVSGGAWDESKRALELRITRLLNLLHIPTHGDIEALNARVAELNRHIETLTAQRSASAGAPEAGKNTRSSTRKKTVRKKSASRARSKAANTRSKRS